MKIRPKVSEQERDFVQNLLSGMSASQCYIAALPEKSDSMTPSQISQAARDFKKKKNVDAFLKYMESATPEEIIRDLLIESIAFSDGSEAMRAAKQFLDSQVAGKDIAELYIRYMTEIGGEIVVPCQGRAERARLGS